MLSSSAICIKQYVCCMRSGKISALVIIIVIIYTLSCEDEALLFYHKGFLMLKTIYSKVLQLASCRKSSFKKCNIWGNSEIKLNFEHYNLLCRKVVAVCWKIATLIPTPLIRDVVSVSTPSRDVLTVSVSSQTKFSTSRSWPKRSRRLVSGLGTFRLAKTCVQARRI